MSKVLGLDLGDQWVGVAISDVTVTIVKPYTTVAVADLEKFLTEITAQEQLREVVVGYPKTMKGGESEQTHKIVAQVKKLQQILPQIQFILWDERLSSKRAEKLSSSRSRDEKLKSHALAAAFILDSYITYLKANGETEHTA